MFYRLSRHLAECEQFSGKHHPEKTIPTSREASFFLLPLLSSQMGMFLLTACHLVFRFLSEGDADTPVLHVLSRTTKPFPVGAPPRGDSLNSV